MSFIETKLTGLINSRNPLMMKLMYKRNFHQRQGQWASDNTAFLIQGKT